MLKMRRKYLGDSYDLINISDVKVYFQLLHFMLAKFFSSHTAAEHENVTMPLPGRNSYMSSSCVCALLDLLRDLYYCVEGWLGLALAVEE